MMDEYDCKICNARFGRILGRKESYLVDRSDCNWVKLPSHAPKEEQSEELAPLCLRNLAALEFAYHARIFLQVVHVNTV